MSILKGFTAFVKRVLAAAKRGGLSTADLKKLAELLRRTGRKNAVLARGLLSALSSGGATQKDIRELGSLLRIAEERIARGEEPFNEIEKSKLASIFRRASLSPRAARWFTKNLDGLLAEELREQAEDVKERVVPKRRRRATV